MKAALALLVCGTLSAAAVLATRSVASADSVKDLLGGSNAPTLAPHYDFPQGNQSTYSHDYRHVLYVPSGPSNTGPTFPPPPLSSEPLAQVILPEIHITPELPHNWYDNIPGAIPVGAPGNPGPTA